MPRRWTRTAALAMLFVAFGAATATGVAWRIALSRTWESLAQELLAKAHAQPRGDFANAPLYHGGFYYWPSVPTSGVTEIRTTRRATLPSDEVRAISARRRLLDPDSPNEAPMWGPLTPERPPRRVYPGPNTIEIIEHHYGWPMRSHWFYSEDQGFNVANTLFCEGLWRLPRRFDSSVDLAASNGHQPDKASKRIWLPIYILPLGFTLNTLFYAAAWFMCLFGISSTRRILRARRGLCTRCAYDLKGLPPGSPCPECGAVLAVSITNATA